MNERPSLREKKLGIQLAERDREAVDMAERLMTASARANVLRANLRNTERDLRKLRNQVRTLEEENTTLQAEVRDQNDCQDLFEQLEDIRFEFDEFKANELLGQRCMTAIKKIRAKMDQNLELDNMIRDDVLLGFNIDIVMKQIEDYEYSENSVEIKLEDAESLASDIKWP